MGVHLCPREIFSFGGRQEAKNGEPITNFIYFGFPEAIITSTPHYYSSSLLL
jgi:hypothetical protein